MSLSAALPYMAQIFVTVGLTAWVYTTLKTSFEAITKSQNQKIESLEREVRELKVSENKWFKKYHKMLSIFTNESCKSKDCPVRNKVNEFLSDDGEAV